MTWVLLGVVALFVAAFAWQAWAPAPPRDRVGLLTSATDALAALAAARALVGWDVVPVALWHLLVGLTGLALVGAARRWPGLERVRSERPRARQVAGAVQVLVALVVVAVLA
jgi:hypothetical protein